MCDGDDRDDGSDDEGGGDEGGAAKKFHLDICANGIMVRMVMVAAIEMLVMVMVVGMKVEV